MKFDLTRIAIEKFGEVDDIDDDVAKQLMEKAKKIWNNQYTNSRVIDAGSLLGNAALTWCFFLPNDLISSKTFCVIFACLINFLTVNKDS